jgi:hypothetical protein
MKATEITEHGRYLWHTTEGAEPIEVAVFRNALDHNRLTLMLLDSWFWTMELEQAGGDFTGPLPPKLTREEQLEALLREAVATKPADAEWVSRVEAALEPRP